MKRFMLVVVLLLFVGCGKKTPNSDNVKVGMTYEEVESMFGKPTDIRKGFTELSFSDSGIYVSLSSDLCKNFLDQFQTLLKQDSTLGHGVPSIDTKGQLIYTTWFVERSATRFDTLKVVTPDTTIKTQGTTYWTRLTPQYYGEKWEQVEKFSYDYYREKATYMFETKTGQGLVDSVVVGIRKYVITLVFAIHFDSASGRVVSCNYQPISVYCVGFLN